MNLETLMDHPEILKEHEEYGRDIFNALRGRDLDESKQFVEKLIEVSQKYNLVKVYPWLIHALARIVVGLGGIQKAIDLEKQVYKLFEQLEDKEGLLVAANGLLGCYIAEHTIEEAVKWGIKGMELCKDSTELSVINTLKVNMACVYMIIEEYEQALEILEQLEKTMYFDNKENEPIAYLHRAVCEYHLGHMDLVRKYIDKGTQLAEKSTPFVAAEAIRIKGFLCIRSKAYEQAEAFLQESLQRVEKFNLNWCKYNTLLDWSEIDLARGDYEAALSKLQKVLKYSEESGVAGWSMVLYERMHQSYRGLGEHEKAYEYLEKYTTSKLKLAEVRSRVQIDQLSFKKKQDEAAVYKMLYEQTEKLYRIGQNLTSKLKVEDVFEGVVEAVQGLVKQDLVEVIYREEGVFKYKQASLGKTEFGIYQPENLKEMLAYECITMGKEKLINTLSDFDQDSKGVKCALFVPILFNENIIGSLGVISFTEGTYGIKELSSLRLLATYIGVALESARVHKEAQYIAHFDGLTHLLNRKEVLRKSYDLYAAHGDLVIMMIDIDDLKKINETAGYLVGDKVLSKVASTIESCIYNEGIVGRYGEEEFLVALPFCKKEVYLKKAEAVRREVEQLNIEVNERQSIKITVSIGVVALSAAEYTLDQVIRLADKALYKAKGLGKNKVVEHI